MSWVRFSDTWAEQPRVEALSDAALALYVASVCYSARHSTDGVIPAPTVRRLRAAADVETVVAELVAADFLADQGEAFLIVDWREHLIPADEVRRHQERKAKNMADWRARRHNVTDRVTGNEPGKSPSPLPAPPRNNVEGGRGASTTAPGGASFGPPPGEIPTILGLDHFDEDDE